MIRILLTSCILLILCACSTHTSKGYVKLIDNRIAIKENSQLYVKVPEGTAIIIGKAEPNAGNVDHTSILYPAITPVDFFAAVITHAAITESVKNNKKNKVQDEADIIVIPYRPFIKDVANQALITQLSDIALSRGFHLKPYSEIQSDDDIVLDITPIYLLNQKQNTLTLRTQFLVYYKKNESIATQKRVMLYQNQIEILSPIIQSESPADYWLNNNGEKLIETMRNLLSDTLALGALQISSNEKAIKKSTEKNFRYDDGDVLAFERASVITEDCERIVIHTLRGWLKSIPTGRLQDRHPCKIGQEAKIDTPMLN
ncbi:hypothetical protein [Shewanella baltica]|uniref:hypothetical protein n=1 Tax=Shewanella baltica TaxID=62322 RepID=UPI00325F61B0